MDMYTLLYLKEITKKDLLYSTRNSAQCYVATWMEGEFGGEWILCICTAESLCCPPETIVTLLIGYESESCSVVSTLCDSMDDEILQARILEWVAFPFSKGSSQPRDQTLVSRIVGGFFTS